MTDRISIPALRQHGRSYPFSDDETMDALIKAIEAAHAHISSAGLPAKLYQASPDSWQKLHEALARFDFGEDA